MVSISFYYNGSKKDKQVSYSISYHHNYIIRCDLLERGAVMGVNNNNGEDISAFLVEQIIPIELLHYPYPYKIGLKKIVVMPF